MLVPPADTSRVPLPKRADVDSIRGPHKSVPSGFQSRPDGAGRRVPLTSLIVMIVMIAGQRRRQAPRIASLDMYLNFTAVLLVKHCDGCSANVELLWGLKVLHTAML